MVHLDVPPTLVSFAITKAEANEIVTPELKGGNHTLVEVMLPKDKFFVYDFEALRTQYDRVTNLMKEGKVYSAYTVKDGGVIEAVYKMAFGNEIGVKLNSNNTLESLIEKNYGHIILEVENEDVSTYKNLNDFAGHGVVTNYDLTKDIFKKHHRKEL